MRMRAGDGPRRRRMIRGTIVRIGDLDMRYGQLSQLATLDCTSSRRSTVMCALPRATAVTTEYQRDSSSKRPRASVVSAIRAPTRRNTTRRTRHPGLRGLRPAPAAPLDAAPTTWSDAIREQADACSATAKPRSKDRGLTRGHSISARTGGQRRLRPQWPRSQRGKSDAQQGYSPLTRRELGATARYGPCVTAGDRQRSCVSLQKDSEV